MARKGDSFIFYREETLTDPNGSVFRFVYSDTYPIGIATGGVKDLQLYVDWNSSFVIDIFYDLEEKGILASDIGVNVVELLAELKGQPLYFNGTLSKYFTINLTGLENISEEIKFATMTLTSQKLTIDTLTEFLPEFILDFGEGLEEKLTHCWVGGAGVLDEPFINNYDPEESLKYLMEAYMSIENADYVLNYFDPSVIEEQFEEHIQSRFPIHSSFVSDYKVNFGSLKGDDTFRSLLRDCKNSLPANPSLGISDLYEQSLFIKNNVKIEVTVISTHSQTEPLDYKQQNAFIEHLTYTKRKHCMLINRAHYHPANVWWEIYDTICVDENPKRAIWTFNIYPRFGTF